MKIGNLEVYGVIYKIENLVNGKIYIGQTTVGFNRRYNYQGLGIERVYKFHLNEKENNRRYNKHLLNSIKKYGFKVFKVNKIFDIAFSENELNIKEQCWIKINNSFNNGYNNNLGGNGGNNGYKHSKETKEKMKENHQYKYGANHYEAKKVVCLNTKQTFDFMGDAIEKYNINASSLTLCCQNKIKYVTTITGEKLTWMYYDEYLKADRYYIEQKILQINDTTRTNKVVCLNTNKIFYTAKEASLFYNCDSSGIIKCCKGKSNSCGKLNGESLVWMYYSDFINSDDKTICDKIHIASNINKVGNNNYKIVLCINTELIFLTLKEAGKYYKISDTLISACCKGKLKSAGKRPITGEPLQWEYIKDLTSEEYIKYDIKNKLKELELSNQDSSFLVSKNN